MKRLRRILKACFFVGTFAIIISLSKTRIEQDFSTLSVMIECAVYSIISFVLWYNVDDFCNDIENKRSV